MHFIVYSSMFLRYQTHPLEAKLDEPMEKNKKLQNLVFEAANDSR